MNEIIQLRLDAGSLGVLLGELNPTTGVVTCTSPGLYLDVFSAARCLRRAIEDGRLDVPGPVRAEVDGGLLLTAGVGRG